MTPTPDSSPSPPLEHQSLGQRIWSAGQFVVALVLTLGALAYLLLVPASKPVEPPADDRAADPVQVAGPNLLRVDPASPLAAKLQVAAVRPTRVTAPVLAVTGTVAASLRPGKGKGNDYWQFNSPEVLTVFTDWQKATADIVFTRSQLTAVKELAAARKDAQARVVERIEKLVKAGTDAEKDLATARADQKQAEIQARKDIYEAETAVRVAQRNEAATARQLQQAGLDPALLTAITSDVDIVMADVPEGFLGRVGIGQGCEARFFGIPDHLFRGQVKIIAPVVTKDRRSLRVLFTVEDLKDELRPGMFAEIGLGTDARDALLVPAEGVIHVGRTDYLLVAAGEPGAWRIAPVQVGEARGGKVEILKGLHPGDRVMGQGAILLKPAVAKALLQTPDAGNGGGP
jgi:hypothetical protein